MKRDYVRESANYVRGALEDAILSVESNGLPYECTYCNKPVYAKGACVSNCPNCGNEMHTCGD